MCGIFGIISRNPREECLYEDVFNMKFNTLKHRGPDRSRTRKFKHKLVHYYLGFHRLAIVGPTEAGDQPFVHENCIVICNGEIYNYKDLIREHKLNCKSQSDCEVILHLYRKYGFEKTMELLRGEYALVLIDLTNEQLFFVRDHSGVRPLFMHVNDETIIFSSEAKADDRLIQLNPNMYYNHDLSIINRGKFVERCMYPKPIRFHGKKYQEVESIMNKEININFTRAVERRLYADRNIGFFLSGGLDSSLVLGVAMKLIADNPCKYKIIYPINVFSIGFHDSTDVKNAKIVVDFLLKKYGKYSIKHHIVTYNLDDGIKMIPETIQCLESYDTTTIRASTLMYCLAKYVSNNTNIKVLLSGEGSDELLGGYLYFHYSPSPEEFDKENRKLLSRLHLYDNLRADRCVAANGLELRVPFLDEDFVNCILSYSPLVRTPPGIFNKYERKGYNTKIEKYILRNAFNTDNIIPRSILWSQKQAFSDGVGYSWRNYIKTYTDKLELKEIKYNINPPQNNEEKYYRQIFEQLYPNRGRLIPEMWLPNKQWVDTGSESSATVLKFHEKNLNSKL